MLKFPIQMYLYDWFLYEPQYWPIICLYSQTTSQWDSATDDVATPRVQNMAYFTEQVRALAQFILYTGLFPPCVIFGLLHLQKGFASSWICPDKVTVVFKEREFETMEFAQSFIVRPLTTIAKRAKIKTSANISLYKYLLKFWI